MNSKENNSNYYDYLRLFKILFEDNILQNIIY
jgi:hypothetical protein